MLQSTIWNPLQGKPRYQYRPRLNPAHPLSTGLVSWWMLNEGGGGSAIDLQSLNHGYISNPTWTSFAAKEALYIDNVNACAVPYNPSLDLSVNYTLSCWINRKSGQAPRALMKYTTTGNFRCFYLTTSSTQVIFWSSPDGTLASGQSVTVTYTTTPGLWHHILASKQGGDVTIYINGIARNTPDGSISATRVGGGVLNIIPAGQGTSYIADAQIYNRALSDKEALYLYISPFGTPSNPRLIVEPRYAPWVSVGGAPVTTLPLKHPFYRPFCGPLGRF